MKKRHMYWLPVLVLAVAAFVPALMGCEETPKSGTTDDREFNLSIKDGIENGTITTNPPPGLVKVNTEITVTVSPEIGYELTPGSVRYNGKTTTGSSSKRTFKMPAEDAEVTAAFRIPQVITEPSVNPGQDDIDALGDWDAQIAAWKEELLPIVRAMTIDQLAGQMTQGLMDQMGPNQDGTNTATFVTADQYFVGSILAGGHNQPNQSQFGGAFGSTAEPQSWRNLTNKMVERSLLVTSYLNGVKIPLIFGLDCMHGASKIQDATMLPHNIGLGAIAVGDRNKGIQAAFDAAQLTSREMLSGGLRWTFGPVLGVSENNGWGRMYECYSERAEIVAFFGKYFTRGLHLAGVATCPKHFGPEGQTINGGNSNANANITLAEYKSGRNDAPAHLKQSYILPFEEAIKERTMSIMMCYNSRNGTRIHEDAELMNVLLKGEMGFQGMILTDWNSLNSISGANYAARVSTGINAGIDMVMAANSNWLTTINAIKSEFTANRLTRDRLEDAVLRCLLFKKSIGHQSTSSNRVCTVEGCTAPGCNGEHNFWNHPQMLAPVNKADSLRTPDNIKLAANLVADSLVLLKNEDNVIQRLQAGEFKNILLTGSGTANIGLQNGGWTIQWEGSQNAAPTAGVNIEQGIRALLTEQGRSDITVTRNAGSSATTTTHDVVIAVVSENPYAESEQLTGNVMYRSDDNNVLTNAYNVKTATGESAPVIMIVISGRPLNLTTHFDTPKGIIAAWLPGTEGGTGIAEMLFTDREYVGKTAYTWIRARVNLGNPWIGIITYPYSHGLRKDGTPCECAEYVTNEPGSGCWLDHPDKDVVR